MVANHHFIAKEYLRAFELKETFAKYSVYYTNLHYPSEPLSNRDRFELTTKLEEMMNDISVQVLKMKEPKCHANKLERRNQKPSMQLC